MCWGEYKTSSFTFAMGLLALNFMNWSDIALQIAIMLLGIALTRPVLLFLVRFLERLEKHDPVEVEELQRRLY
jgi:hypothetical protein